MNQDEWESYKEHLTSTYQPEDIMVNEDEKGRSQFSFKLGGYGFRFIIGYVRIEGTEIIQGFVNSQYCFLHIGNWRDMKTPNEVKTKLALAKRDADKDDRFEDQDFIKKKDRKLAKKRESKIVFKRK